MYGFHGISVDHYPLPSLFRSWNRIRVGYVLSLPIRIALYALVEGYLLPMFDNKKASEYFSKKFKFFLVKEVSVIP